MPRPALRSRSFRKLKVRTPGGRVVMHFEKRKPKVARCGRCNKPLHGVPQARPSKMKNIPKSSRRPERPYGGNLCSPCSRVAIKEKFIYTK